MKTTTFQRHLASALKAVLFAVIVSGCQSGRVADAHSVAVTESERPNIIYILADDLGYADIAPYGQRRFATPNLQRLADSGMLFTQHYSGATICAPSRSTLLTGQHTGHTQIRHNGGNDENATALAKGPQTLITMLHDAGYKTGAVGKWGMGTYKNSGSPAAQKIDYFYGYVTHKDAHNYYPPYLTENGERQMLDNDGIDVHGPLSKQKDLDPADVYTAFIGNDYAPELIHEKAKGFIRDNKDEPFFLYYASTIPHAALQIPEARLTPFAYEEFGSTGEYYTHHPRPRAARAAMIQQLDAEVGGLLDYLEAEGLRDSTLVIFASDNGASVEGGSDVEFFNSSNPFRGYKRDLTEGGIRVPMIASWPGRIEAGKSSDQVTAMWDVMPTLADITKTNVTAKMDGVSIAPTLLGESGQAQHPYLYWEFHGSKRNAPAQAVRLGDWKGLRVYGPVGAKTKKPGPIQLYDLSSDPKELNDLAQFHPDVVARMEAIMDSRAPSPNPRWNF